MRAITKNTRRVTALTLAAALVVAVYVTGSMPAPASAWMKRLSTSRRWLWRGEPVAAPVTDGLMTGG